MSLVLNNRVLVRNKKCLHYFYRLKAYLFSVMNSKPLFDVDLYFTLSSPQETINYAIIVSFSYLRAQ